MEKREHESWIGPRSVLLLDALSPSPILFESAEGRRVGRAGLSLSCHPIDQQLPNVAVRNKRAAGGGVSPRELGTNLSVRARFAGWGSSQGDEDESIHRARPVAVPLQTQTQGRRPPARFLF